jgi:hypothetical protein
MTEAPSGVGLALDDVVHRFAESAQALEDARQKLDALAAAEATQVAAAQSLQEASAKATQFAEAAGVLVAQAAETQRVAREVLESGARLIAGTDLSELRSGLVSASEALEKGFARVEGLLGDIEKRDQRIAELEVELARRTNALSLRQKKKLGID